MSLTHFNNDGRAHMVEVSEKKDTVRTAIARGNVRMKRETVLAIKDSKISKGDVLAVAQVAGIMGAKRTSDIIPMCHPLMLTAVDLRFFIDYNKVLIEAEVKTIGKTGVEMEALSAVNIAALTIYDMCKAIDKDIMIDNVRLVKKTGGKSGVYIRSNEMNDIIGKVKSINISKEKGVIKEAIDEGFFEVDHGLVGDAHAGKWHRQVSLLAQESIDKMTKIGVEGLCSGKFAENLTTEGIILHELPVGTYVKIGETIQEVSQIGKECHTGCAIKEQVGQCIMPKEGIFTKVIKSGKVRSGDTIEIVKV